MTRKQLGSFKAKIVGSVVKPLVDPLRAPFPWFGGKSRAASIVWDAFGNVDHYVEPFAGSLAVLLARPHAPRLETVNDLDCYLANFWRALSQAPEEVAKYADWPVNEADMSARHQWLVDQAEFRERMATDHSFFDARIAGWWVWGVSAWIGSGWCDAAKYRDERKLPHLGDAGRGVNRKLPHLGDAGRGVNRKLPHLGDAGMGVNRKLPHLGDAGMGVNRQLPHLTTQGMGVNRQLPHLTTQGMGVIEYMQQLGKRLRKVRVACGSWERVLGANIRPENGTVGVLLDPPYFEGNVDYAAGGAGTNLSKEVREWALANHDQSHLRIALCGYEGEHEMPETWRCVEWKARKGYATSTKDRKRERIWLSPNCLKGRSLPSGFVV